MINSIQFNSNIKLNEEKIQTNRLQNLLSKLEKNILNKNIDTEEKNIIATIFNKIKKITMEMDNIDRIKPDMKSMKASKAKNRYKDFLYFLKDNTGILFKHKINLTVGGLIYIVYSYIYSKESLITEEYSNISDVAISSVEDRAKEKEIEVEDRKNSSDFKRVANSLNIKKRKSFLDRVFSNLNISGTISSNTLSAFIPLFTEKNEMFNETIFILKKLGLR